MMMHETPSALQLDALRELANVGCGHAATALSQLVGGSQVFIELPQVLVAPVSKMPDMLGGSDIDVVSASIEMHGDLTGRVLLLLSPRDAQQLCALLLNAPCSGAFTSVQQSAFREAANIVGSACLNAIGALTGLKLIPSPPTFSEDVVGNLLDEAMARSSSEAGLVVMLQVGFQAATAPALGGQLLVLPERQGLQALLERLGV